MKVLILYMVMVMVMVVTPKKPGQQTMSTSELGIGKVTVSGVIIKNIPRLKDVSEPYIVKNSRLKTWLHQIKQREFNKW